MPLFPSRRYSHGSTQRKQSQKSRFSFKKALSPKRKPPRFREKGILEGQHVRVKVDWDDIEFTHGVVERYNSKTDTWRVWMGPDITQDCKADRLTKEVDFTVFKAYRRHVIYNTIKKVFLGWDQKILELICGLEVDLSLEVCTCGLSFRNYCFDEEDPSKNAVVEARKLLNDQHGDIHMGKACRNGCLSCLVCILAKDPESINMKNSSQRTGCYIAAMKGHDQFIRSLYAHNANVHTANENNATPLYIASEYGCVTCIKSLFEFGADLNIQEKNYGVSPCVVATQEGHLESVKMLCKLGCNVNLTRKSKASPVYIAAQKGYDKILRCLLKYEANINLTNENGATPIYISSLKANNDVLRTLHAHKADVNQYKHNGASPMLIAAQKGHLDTCKLLLQLGSELNPKRKDHVTPFFVALWEKQFHVTRWYSQKGVTLLWSFKLLRTFPNLVEEGKQWVINTMENDRKKEVVIALEQILKNFPMHIIYTIAEWEMMIERMTTMQLIQYARKVVVPEGGRKKFRSV